jgi:O-antigen/teichoic acid export membrane protein
LGLTNNVIKGSLWIVGLRMAIKCIGIISTMFLARLLLPSDFGLIAMAMVYYAFVELIQSFGFDMALIQNQNSTDEHYNTVWTTQLLFGLFSSIIVFTTAPLVASIMETPLLTDVLQALALMFLIQGFRNVGTVNFTKHFEFHKEFILRILPKIVTTIITITLAYIYKSYWALIIGMLLNVAITVILSYIICSYRPSLHLSKFKEIFSFSKWLLINNVLMFANNKLQDFVIGYKNGTESLGFFTISSELGNIITNEVVAPMNKATYPAYSKMSEDAEALKAMYLNTLSTVSLVAFPLSIGLALVAPTLIPLLLGDNWDMVIPLIQIISIAGAVRAITTNADYIFMARGKPRLITWLFSLRLVILIPLLLLLTTEMGVEGAAIAILLTTLVIYPVSVFITLKEVDISLVKYVGAITSSLIAALTMTLALFWLPDDGSILALIFIILTGAVTYMAVLFLLWRLKGKPQSVEKKLFDLALSRLPVKRWVG